MTPDHGPHPEPRMDLGIPFLGIGQTVVIRNEFSIKLLRFDTAVRQEKPVKYPLVKIFAPEEFEIFATREGAERRMHSIFDGDGYGTTTVRLSPGRTSLSLGEYLIRTKPTPLSDGLTLGVTSSFPLPHFIVEGIPSRQIRALMVRERQSLRV